MPAILTLTYTPNYPGNHRVCFRTTQPSYCCYTDDSTSFVGTPKTIEIDLEDFELCLQDLPVEVGCAGSVVEGYIQPLCIEQGSDVNRIAFTATFPSNPCTPYKVECTESGVAEIQITDPGSGYGPSEIPAMLISSIYGQDATAEPVMDCVAPSGPCFVANVNITNPGFNYYTPQSITVTIDPPLGGGTTATAEVIAVDDCGTFTIPNCDGTENTTEYQLIGSSYWRNSINVCAGSSGPEAFKYTVTPNPDYLAEGPELVVNGSFTNDLSGWTYFPDDPNTPADVFWTSQGVTWDPADEPKGLTQDILTVGKYYIIDITLTCDYGPFFPFPIPQNQVAFELSFGTNTLAPIVFSGIQQSYQFNYVSCLGNPTFRIVALNGYAPGNQVAEMSCSYVSIREMDVPYPVSCCDCVKYDVVNNCYLDKDIDIYYTDCNQIIQTLTVGATPTTICSVRDSAWPVNKDDNPCIEITLSATQDC
jgi:hypothetical protein